jgi:hypothetical protein
VRTGIHRGALEALGMADAQSDDPWLTFVPPVALRL